MNRISKGLTTLALSLALAGTVATAALAASPTGSAGDVNDARKALYESQLEQNLQSRTAAGTQAAEQGRAGERNLVPVVAIAALGLIGAAAVVAGTAANRRRRHRVVAA
jgi:hypothetical protein